MSLLSKALMNADFPTFADPCKNDQMKIYNNLYEYNLNLYQIKAVKHWLKQIKDL